MSLFWITAAASFMCSILAKVGADVLLGDRVSVLGSFVGLQYSRNPGIAFGLRLPGVMQELFIGAALLLVCVLAWKSAKTTLSQAGYGLIVGGALGNVVDRVGDGYVTDFFQVGTFPIFNIADSCITIGVVFLLAEMIFLNPRTKH